MNIQYQDLVIPNDEKTGMPANPIAKKLAEEMLVAASHMTHMPVYTQGPMWSIQHGYQHQTYPHSHYPSDVDLTDKIPLAGVYWAEIPEGSGSLEFYPTGVINELCTYVMPVVGDFIIFPADVVHGVRQNTNRTETRVSCSLNMISTNIPFDILNKEHAARYNT